MQQQKESAEKQSESDVFSDLFLPPLPHCFSLWLYLASSNMPVSLFFLTLFQ
jgi:hypothetical protein